MSAEQKKDEPEPGTSTPKKRRARRWLRALLVFFAVLLILRIALAIFLPVILDHWAKPLGLSCTYERLDISPLRGRIELWHLALEPRHEASTAPAGEPAPSHGPARKTDELAHLEYATVDVDVGALFTLAFKLDRVEIDGLDVHAVRESDGTLNFARYFASTPPSETPHSAKAPPASQKSDASNSSAAAQPIHLAPPIEIAAVRMQRVRVHFEDAHVNPPIDARLDLDISASDVGSKRRPLHVELTALSPENLGSVFIESDCTGDDATLHAELDITVDVFQPQTFRGYLEPMGISPYAKQISFRMRGAADAAVHGERKDEVGAALELRDLRLSDDLDEALALDSLTCKVDSISSLAAHIARIEISGVRAAAARLPSGALRFAGIDLFSSDDAATSSDAATETAAADAQPYPVRIDEILLRKSAVRFQDAAVEPRADVALELDELGIRHIATAPAEATVPITLHAALRAPRVADNLKLDGELALFSRQKSVSITLGADHITLEGIAPYLRAAHLAPDLKSGTLACKISGRSDEDAGGVTRGRLQLEGFRLTDVDEIFAIDRIALEEIVIDPARALVRLGQVEIAGTRGGLDRDPELSVHLFGLRTLPVPKDAPSEKRASAPAHKPANAQTNAQPTPTRAAHVASTPAPSSRSSLFELGSFVWHDATLHYRDRALEPALALTFADAKLEAHDLSFGGEAGDPARKPANIEFLLHAPGIAEKIECSATIRSQPGPVDLEFDVKLQGQGLRAGELSPYLLDQGVDSKLDGAEIAVDMKCSVKAQSDSIAAGFSIERAELRNKGQSVASIAALRLSDAHIGTDSIRIGEVSIENPRAVISRDATGALILGGVRFVPPTPPQPGHRSPPPLFQPFIQPLINLVAAELAAKNFIVERVRTSGVDVEWIDASMSPPVDVHALLGLRVDGFVMGEAAPPAKFAIDVAVPGVLEKLELGGTLSLEPGAGTAELAFDARGLEVGPLTAYLPPGIASDLHGGALGFHLQAAAGSVSEGGVRANLDLRDLVYTNGAAVDPLFKMSSLALHVARADPEARVFKIDEVSFGGLESTARRDAQGDLHLLGFTLGATNAGSVESATSSKLADAPASSAPGITGASPETFLVPPSMVDSSSSAAPSNATWQTRAAPPTVRLEKIDLGIDKLTFIDETHGPGAVPIVGSMHVASTAPMSVLDANPGELPPAHLEFKGSLEPITKDIQIALDVAPFADEPTISVSLAAHGLRGEGLTEIAPELAARIDGRGLTEGELAGSFQAQLSMERRSATSFDFHRSFGVNLAVIGLALRDRPGGAILAGLDAFSVNADRIVPSTGYIHITTIDVIKPRAILHKEADGVHLLGLIVKPAPVAQTAPANASQGDTSAPAAGQPATPAAQGDAAVAAQGDAAVAAQGDAAAGAQADAGAAQGNAAVAAQTSAPGSASVPTDASSMSDAPPRPPYEVRVDQFSVSGIDVDIRDDSVKPPLVLPLVDLEATVNRFTTKAFEEPIPVRFSVFLAAGDVALPTRSHARGRWTKMLTDLPGVSTVTGLVSGSKGEVPQSLRPAFDEFSVSGAVSFRPRLSGTIIADLRAMELLNFVGLAENADIEIDDGLLDSRVKIEVEPHRGASVDAKFRFSELSLSEPIGGPIQKYLLLPAPLDQVLFVLRDANGDQLVHLSFEVEEADVSPGEIKKAAITTFSELVAKAIAGAPLRILTWIGSLFGIGTSEREALAKQQRSFRFAPADGALSDADLREIAPLAELLKSNDDTMLLVRQELGAGDIARAEVLANPTPEECLEIVARLRQERAELLRRSDEIESQASALWSVGREDMALATSDRLRDIEQEIGHTEMTLDRMLDLVRPGAERYKERRTHEACRVIGAQRIAGLRQFLAASGVKEVDARLEVRSLRPEPTAGAGGGRITLIPRLRSAP